MYVIYIKECFPQSTNVGSGVFCTIIYLGLTALLRAKTKTLKTTNRKTNIFGLL